VWPDVCEPASKRRLQQHGFAITDALSCIALAPTWPKGYYRLGSALAAAKKYGEAADNLRRALALSPDDAAIRAALEDVEKAAAKLGGAGRGYVYTWGAAEAVGRGSDGAEGGGARGASASSTPKMLEGAMGRQVVDVACGLQHTVLVTVGGEVMSWGSNKYGQCGCDRKTELVTRPKYVSGLFGHRCVSVACCGAHTFVITDIGKTFSWGQGACGQLGQGHTNTVVATPSQVVCVCVCMGAWVVSALLQQYSALTPSLRRRGRLQLWRTSRCGAWRAGSDTRWWCWRGANA
jgi:hypothetical protein